MSIEDKIDRDIKNGITSEYIKRLYRITKAKVSELNINEITNKKINDKARFILELYNEIIPNWKDQYNDLEYEKYPNDKFNRSKILLPDDYTIEDIIESVDIINSDGLEAETLTMFACNKIAHYYEYSIKKILSDYINENNIQITDNFNKIYNAIVIYSDSTNRNDSSTKNIAQKNLKIYGLEDTEIEKLKDYRRIAIICKCKKPVL